MQCVDDYTDLNLTGEAVAVDACGINTLFYNDVVDLNSCQVGTITRTWTAEDINGNKNSCLQTIFVEDNTPIEVVFPDAYDSDICGISTDTMFTGRPIILNRDCELVTINYSDDFFDLSAPACYKVFRNWIVVDWCVYDPSSTSTEGYYTHTQIITITDNEAPLFNCLNDTLVGSLDPNCGGTYITFDEVTAIDCSENISYTNNSPYADSLSLIHI